MKPRLLVIFFILFAVMGYMRERFFEYMNILMAGKYRGTDEFTPLHLKLPWLMSPLDNFDYATLYYSKYLFTFLWCLVFYLISLFAIKLMADKKLIKILTYSYLLLLFLAGISMTLGYIANKSLLNDEYTLSRWLLGIAQSPIICFILLAASKLYNKNLNYDK